MKELLEFGDWNEQGKKSYWAAMANGRGHQHELLIEGACRYYASIGRAYIVKEPEPFRVIKKDRINHTAKINFIKKAQPDFHGTLAGGQSIVFEAKYTDTARIKQSVISDEQAKSLDIQLKLGASAFVCVGIQDKAYMVPWKVFRDMKVNFGHKYATQDDLFMYRVINNGVIKFLDFINGVRAEELYS